MTAHAPALKRKNAPGPEKVRWSTESTVGPVEVIWCGIRQHVYVTVTEDEIRRALREFVTTRNMVIEGAAAVDRAVDTPPGRALS